ncbi:cobalt transporter ATP-binding subunit [Serratia proteamaculans]|uniref:AAA family ATPase n=1 Tax=Serratia proteamaculans TaxID=28151 RepID=UPI00217772C1|nr:AAA family ATPase [Serratia proteamaculans]CAI1835956.1 cobalt transporter ATP-binding subunit [Serratia proteamaculans]CAI1960949.1 cobalt transporter ATP-binding subunit [Serratia proteamaculans]
MDVKISHCNNIDYGRIEISENKLNIKFAPNGTGKSTISRAILHSVAGDAQSLSALLPFKLRKSNPSGFQPSVSGAENICDVLCFDEKYVAQFTFQPDELVSNSFDIFIKTEAYSQTESEIETMVIAIRQRFTENDELELYITHLQELSGAFKITSKGLSKASTGMRGLSGGNKLQHIPAGLEPYQPFIQSARNVEWIEWQTKGYENFSEISVGCCPFCTGNSHDKTERIRKVSDEYDKAIIKNLVGIITVLEKLGDYFSDAARERLMEITTLQGGLEQHHQDYLLTIKQQADNLLGLLNTLKTLNSFTFNDGCNVRASLAAYRLDLKFFPDLQSEKTQQTVDHLNASLDALMVDAGQLQGKINIQRAGIQRLIQKHKTDINTFLAYAGYRYQVDISGDGEQCRLKLRHVDFEDYLSGGSQHLSYGERNAFAIVLFMYECLARKPDLIVLDDPISSFDKNKKFAILEMLFRRDTGECLKNLTVLMLTHDVEPIIDTLKSVRKMFSNQVMASYLRYSEGTITELVIRESDIMTFTQICKAVTESECDDLIKLIYLRRHYEILDERSDAYQVISNIFHRRSVPVDTREPAEEGAYPAMAPTKLHDGCSTIAERIPGFNYTHMLNILSTPEHIRALYRRCQTGYEKLQVFRLLEPETDNRVIRKFVNETYHIENEFICQLDPARFDLIPEYVVAECDRLLTPLQVVNNEVDITG